MAAGPRVLGLALLVSAGLAGGAAYALVEASDDRGTTTATGRPLQGPATVAPLAGPTGEPLVLPTEDAGPTVTTTATVSITASDGDGDITFGGLTWGDGSSMGPEVVPGHCPAYPSPTSAPGAYQPHADRRTFTFSHTYPSDQDYTINLTVRSGNDECRPNGPTAESRSAALGVRFAHDAPSPTPSPTATEAPSTGAVDARPGD
jgi:hypothetical protein